MEEIIMNSQFERFMKKNKKIKPETLKYAATKSLVDDNGKPIEWMFRKLTSEETDRIRECSTIDVPIEGKKNMFRPKLDINNYLINLVIASSVEPNLNNAELQDSYGVKDARSLLYAMVDDTGELGKLEQKIQELCGITDVEEEIQEAKN